MGGRPVNIVEGVAYGLPVTESEFGEPMTPTDGPGEPVIIVDDGGIPVKFINDDMSDYTAGITPAMAMLTAYSRTLTDEVASYEATYTGASHKTMFDQYGLQTFGPNQLALHTTDLENAAWVESGTAVVTGDTISLPAVSAEVYQNITAQAGNYILSVELSGSGTLQIGTFDGVDGNQYRGQITLTGTPTRYDFAVSFTVGGTVRFKIASRANNAANTATSVTVTNPRVSRVTYETTFRTCDDVDTTSAAFYGYRCVYAPETLQTSSTSLTIGSGSSYTFGVADESLYSIGDVVQGTNNSDPDAWVRGYVTGTSTGFVTIGTYTFPGTAYSRPVLTNGSGTISDWSVIRSDVYLREPAATNVILHNRDLTNAAWTKSNVTAAKTQTGIDGVTNSASSITATAGNGTCLQAITLASSARFQTAYVKRLVGTGTVEMTMDNGTTWTAISPTAAWARVSIPTQTLANPTVGFRIVTSGDSIAVDFVQNEAGAASTSPIPTAASSVARAADVDSLSTATWWNGSGTFFERAKTPAVGALSILKLDDGTANEVIDLYTNGTDPVLQITDGGATQLAPLDLGTVTADTFHDYAIRIATNNVNGALDGTAVTADTTATLPTVTALSIGEHGGVAHLLYFTSEEIDSVLETGSGA